MKFQNCIIILLLLSGFCSCRSNVFSALEDVESYIQERPDSALAVLQAIDRNALESKKSKAKFSLLYAMALDKNYIDTTDVSIILPAVDYYIRHGSADEKLKTLYYEGRIYENAKEYGSAIISYTKAEKNINLAQDCKYCGMLCREIAQMYTQNLNFSEAGISLERARKYFNQSELAFHEMETLYLIAQNKYNDSRISEAKNDLAEIIEKTDNIKLLARAKALQAFIDITVEPYDPDDALERLSSAISVLGNFPQISHSGAYAYLLAKNGETEAADSVFTYILQSDSPQALRVYHKWKARLAEENSDFKSALNLYKIMYAEQNDVLDLALSQSAARTQRDYFEQEGKKQEEISDNRKKTISRIILIAAILLFVVYYVLETKNRKQNKRNEKLAELNEIVKQQLSEKDKTLSKIRSEYTRIHKDQFALLGQLCETYYRYSSSSEQYRHVYEKVEDIINGMSGDPKSQAEFENIVNDNLNGIMKKFREDFPSRKESEYRFACYLFVGFDATTLLTILNMPSQGAVYAKKNRLKKMIQQSDSINKELFLSMLE